MHLLALRISAFLGMKPDHVLKHWASAKILKSKPSATALSSDGELSADDDVCKMIVDKFNQLGGTDVSYADIAKRAWEVGRAGLATKVCRFFSCGVIFLYSDLNSYSIMNPTRRTKYRSC